MLQHTHRHEVVHSSAQNNPQDAKHTEINWLLATSYWPPTTWFPAVSRPCRKCSLYGQKMSMPLEQNDDFAHVACENVSSWFQKTTCFLQCHHFTLSSSSWSSWIIIIFFFFIIISHYHHHESHIIIYNIFAITQIVCRSTYLLPSPWVVHAVRIHATARARTLHQTPIISVAWTMRATSRNVISTPTPTQDTHH